jgi:uncharacterized protein
MTHRILSPNPVDPWSASHSKRSTRARNDWIARMRYLMIPGYGGSGREHWQSAWQRQLGRSAARIAPASWTDVAGADWRAAISREIDGPTMLIAHSLGCLAATGWLSGNPEPGAVGVFLVAPPDRHGPLFPPVRGFDAAPSRLRVPALVIASSDDPYGGLPAARALSAAWGATLIEAGALGHINPASDLGDWTQGRELLRAFTAGLAFDAPGTQQTD